MAILRLVNGGDVTVKLTVTELLAALSTGSEFVELPGDEGPVHVRPSGVVAVLDHTQRQSSGFRVASSASASASS
jgi:hypothetical protein